MPSPKTRTSRRRSAPADPVRFLTVITRLDLGGAQQVALNTLARLPESRYRKFLIAGAGGLLDEQARALPGVETRLWKTFRHPIRPFCDWVTFWRLAAFMRRERIQVVHTHSSKAGLLGRLAAAWVGVPVIFHTVHGWPFHERQSSLVRNLYIGLERLAARGATRLIAVSAATREKGLAAGIGRPEQYRVVFPGSDLEAFRPGGRAIRAEVRREFGFGKDDLVVAMVGNLKPQKAPLDFVAAAADVARVLPRARFILAGDGPLRPVVQARIAALGLEKTLVLAGWRRDVPRLLAAGDLLALSSLWEGLPCVFAQAMASGLPVAATDVEGAREIVVPEKTGLLVPAGNPEALAQAMIRILKSPALAHKLGAAGKRAAQTFGLEAMLQNLDGLYQEEFKKTTKNKA